MQYTVIFTAAVEITIFRWKIIVKLDLIYSFLQTVFSPVIPSFTIEKWGLKGPKWHRRVSMMSTELCLHCHSGLYLSVQYSSIISQTAFDLLSLAEEVMSAEPLGRYRLRASVQQIQRNGILVYLSVTYQIHINIQIYSKIKTYLLPSPFELARHYWFQYDINIASHS